jgi:uncharacterized protein with predicted RNA binding PUA domain
MLRRVRRIGEYQFGKGCGDALFPHEDVEFIVSRNKIRQVMENGIRIATLRANDGLLTIGVEGARRLHAYLDYPKGRVVVGEDATPFIRKGKNVFARHVIDLDPEIRASEEILVVDGKDELLATGKTLLCADEMIPFRRGVAVDVRFGLDERNR